jgi:methyltransferase (TIGR00027 family)
VARCDRRTVTADLRADWTTAVREAGFDPAVPTAWLAEGLFPYLTDEALDALLGHLHELSAPGSRVTVEHTPRGTSVIEGDLAREIASRASEELTTIWIADQQHDPASWLLGHGWTTAVSRASWVASAYGRPMTDLQPENLRVVQLVTGELG